MEDNSYLEVAVQMRGLQVAQMIHVAAQLGVADRVGEGRPVADLARDVSAHPEKLVRMLRALAAFGIFAVDAEQRVTHTTRSRHLCSDAVPTLHYAARFWGMPSVWSTWSGMEGTIRTGEAAFEATFGVTNWAYLSDHPDEALTFDQFMQHSPDDRHAAVAEAYDFAGAKVVDVGGGNGALLAAILRRYPETTGVLADQGAVIAAATDALGAFISRCELVPTDFFVEVPSGGDIYTMAQILHDWSDERCLQILRNCRRAMQSGAKLLIIERMLDDDPAKNSALTLLGDMQMMALFPGAKERTLGEFTALLAAAGYGAPRVIVTRSAFVVLETAPV
ncbi:MAG: Methyltransferase [Devosia sp.]|uniref:methyltransferase n=1 Tax=Devosia sp. TaxID=1871048 RepID=UPI00261937BE|nr:methyltransferase [Devosia sp.]MDB5531328.1 Methyltransferase [Devosia sp.]